MTLYGATTKLTISTINPNEEVLLTYYMTVNENAIDGEELGIILTVSDININQTHSYIPIYIYGPRLIYNSYEYMSGSIINPSAKPS